MKLPDEDHSRKYVQMHAAAKVLVVKFNVKCPKSFGEYDGMYFQQLMGDRQLWNCMWRVIIANM